MVFTDKTKITYSGRIVVFTYKAKIAYSGRTWCLPTKMKLYNWAGSWCMPKGMKSSGVFITLFGTMDMELSKYIEQCTLVAYYVYEHF